MAETSDVQALEKISTEVDESQFKVILSTQCIKAQAFLVDKLKKQSERSKEICGFLSSANLKLELEIKQAQQEIKNTLISQETIRSANVDLKKEWLLAKDKKEDIVERVSFGEKKYDAMWLEAKSRYESVPYVKRLLDGEDKIKFLQNSIDILENESKEMYLKIEMEQKNCLNIDRERIIKLAQFILYDIPNNIKVINEKTTQIMEIRKQNEDCLKEDSAKKDDINVCNIIEALASEESVDANSDLYLDDWPELPKNIDESSVMPRLELEITQNCDKFVNLEAAKQIETNSSQNIDQRKSQKTVSLQRDNRDYINIFNATTLRTSKEENYSNRKLINILEDVKIDKTEAFNIILKVNPRKLRTVSSVIADSKNISVSSGSNKSDVPTTEKESIEEIDMTRAYTESVLIPPSQFMDITPVIQNSKEDQTKSVTFQLTPYIESSGNEADNVEDNKSCNETGSSQLNISVVSEEGFTKIKDMILKQHNLELSPQFVYAKNNILHKKDDTIVTSKFFNQNNVNVFGTVNESETKTDGQNKMDLDENINTKENKERNTNLDENKMEVEYTNAKEENEIHKPVSGLLFSHGEHEIADSLNVSMSTTGFDDGDIDFPQCIDSSLLLSPKPDMSMPMNEDTPEIQSQEVPNFLSGLRKTGLSFFGIPSLDNKPDSSAPKTDNNFNFNFGGDEKKNRGGLFSMFR